MKKHDEQWRLRYRWQALKKKPNRHVEAYDCQAAANHRKKRRRKRGERPSTDCPFAPRKNPKGSEMQASQPLGTRK